MSTKLLKLKFRHGILKHFDSHLNKKTILKEEIYVL